MRMERVSAVVFWKISWCGCCVAQVAVAITWTFEARSSRFWLLRHNVLLVILLLLVFTNHCCLVVAHCSIDVYVRAYTGAMTTHPIEAAERMLVLGVRVCCRRRTASPCQRTWSMRYRCFRVLNECGCRAVAVTCSRADVGIFNRCSIDGRALDGTRIRMPASVLQRRACARKFRGFIWRAAARIQARACRWQPSRACGRRRPCCKTALRRAGSERRISLVVY